eukprot:TRINITY_DN10749_c0_g1_i1.p1 TRINITY_DN10749_c0_g1~~TRINITY_DN10749_c0_g1_i1.p1  ORF type:complete len:330 (-),score=43.01 TRINITY_DN10749_c0_g1_i1:46-1035(-)
MLDVYLFIGVLVICFICMYTIPLCCGWSPKRSWIKDKKHFCIKFWTQFFTAILLAFVICIIALTAYVVPSGSSLFFVPTGADDEASRYDTNRFTFTELYLPTSDEDTVLHGWYIPNLPGSQVLLYCHGSGANLAATYRLDRYEILLSMGYSIVTFDYPGYGKSTGEPTEDNVFESGEVFLDWIVDNLGLSVSDVVVLGRSMGGSVASKLVLRNPKALILQSAFAKLSDATSLSYPLFWWYIDLIFPVQLDRAEADVGAYSRPTFVYHSPDDGTVPIWSGRKLYDSVDTPDSEKTFSEVDNVLHDDPMTGTEIDDLRIFTLTHVILDLLK